MPQETLRSLLIKAKVTQLFADVFAVFGVFLFIYIYMTQYKNNPFQAMHDPTFVITILIPFIPAAVFAFIASRKRREIRKLVEEQHTKKTESAK